MDNKEKKVSIIIESGSINSGAITKISTLSHFNHILALQGSISSINKGLINEENKICSTEKDGIYFIEAEIYNLFTVKKCFEKQEQSPHNIYSYYFFPFLSSIFNQHLEIQGGIISSIIFSIPDKYKAIWHLIEAKNESLEEAKISHDQNSGIIKYIFQWEQSHSHCVSLSIPIRLGGNTFLKITEYPIYYLIVTLAGIALATYLGSIKVLLGALLAAFSFMIKQWGNSGIPQSFTLYTHFFRVIGLYLILWSLIWFQSKYIGIFLITPTLVIIYISLKTINKFKYSGKLPRFLVKYWCSEISKNLKYKKKISKSN